MPNEFDHVESPIMRGILTGEIAPTPDLLAMAVDYAYLQNEYSERCDGEDFAVDAWEEMQDALERASACSGESLVEARINALREYYRRWQRFSTIY